jgi:hypothetical protein
MEPYIFGGESQLMRCETFLFGRYLPACGESLSRAETDRRSFLDDYLRAYLDLSLPKLDLDDSRQRLTDFDLVKVKRVLAPGRNGLRNR